MRAILLFMALCLLFGSKAQSSLPFSVESPDSNVAVTEDEKAPSDMEERIYCIASTDEEARAIAQAYGLTFIERSGRIAYMKNETKCDTEELISAGMEKGLPPVSIVQQRELMPCK